MNEPLCPATLPFAIMDQEMKDLMRFHECVMDGAGDDVTDVLHMGRCDNTVFTTGELEAFYRAAQARKLAAEVLATTH